MSLLDEKLHNLDAVVQKLIKRHLLTKLVFGIVRKLMKFIRGKGDYENIEKRKKLITFM